MHLADLLNPPAWQQHAACRGLDPNLFFPERGELADNAKEVCETCPVIAQCYEAGTGEHFGIWGGVSQRQRRRARGWNA